MVDGLHLHRIEPGTKVDLRKLDPDDTSAAPGDKARTTAALVDLRARLEVLQERLWGEHSRSLLLVLQGLDTSGKGGIIKHVLGGTDPAGVRVTSFKAPSEEERARDYLWRVHANVPTDGEVGVFDRSHYEDVLIVRAEELLPKAVWKRRYGHITAFEQMLADEGTTIVKVLLHISRDEQRRRLQARLDQPDKRWKFNPADLTTREHWDAYRGAFEEAIERTTAEHSPWYVVPADHKWYARWAVASILVAVLEDMDPQYPEPPDLTGVTIPE